MCHEHIQTGRKLQFCDVVPDDSYIEDLFNAYDGYMEESFLDPYAYFCFVKQSNPQVSEDMKLYFSRPDCHAFSTA